MPTLADLLKTQRPSMVGMVGNSQPIRTLANTIQGYTPPQMTAFTNPQVMDYAKGVGQSAQQNLQTQISDLNKALVMGDKGVEIGDKIALTRLLDQIPGLMGAVAYHGTPHTIKGQFDINKVGSGEGSQAFGHGMYFAENPKVAEGYRHMLSVDPNVASEKIQFATLEKFANKEKNAVKREIQAFIDGTGNYNDFVRIINEQGSKQFKNALLKDEPNLFGAGNLYKVDIPDADIPNMLQWDKPLSQQPKAVQEAIKQIPVSNAGQKLLDKDPNGSALYEMLADYGNHPEKASKQLNALGIKGIRYLDAGSRPTNVIDKRLEDLYQKHNGDIEKAAHDFMRTIHDSPKKKTEIRAGIIQDLQNRPTSNFVVFDPSNVKILEQNSKPYDALEEFIKFSSK
jgi:hypothetical protein